MCNMYGIDPYFFTPSKWHSQLMYDCSYLATYLLCNIESQGHAGI